MRIGWKVLAGAASTAIAVGVVAVAALAGDEGGPRNAPPDVIDRPYPVWDPSQADGLARNPDGSQKWFTPADDRDPGPPPPSSTSSTTSTTAP